MWKDNGKESDTGSRTISQMFRRLKAHLHSRVDQASKQPISSPFAQWNERQRRLKPESVKRSCDYPTFAFLQEFSRGV